MSSTYFQLVILPGRVGAKIVKGVKDRYKKVRGRHFFVAMGFWKEKEDSRRYRGLAGNRTATRTSIETWCRLSLRRATAGDSVEGGEAGGVSGGCCHGNPSTVAGNIGTGALRSRGDLHYSRGWAGEGSTAQSGHRTRKSCHNCATFHGISRDIQCGLVQAFSSAIAESPA